MGVKLIFAQRSGEIEVSLASVTAFDQRCIKCGAPHRPSFKFCAQCGLPRSVSFGRAAQQISRPVPQTPMSSIGILACVDELISGGSTSISLSSCVWGNTAVAFTRATSLLIGSADSMPLANFQFHPI
jgi:hypothetical protein